MTTIGTPRGRHALSVTIAFMILATIFVCIRVYTRTFLVKQMGGDDWTILASFVRPHARSQVVVNSFNEKYRIQVFSWAFFGLFVGEVKYLMGEHLVNIPRQIYIKQMLCFWASVPFYHASLFITKISILIGYKRLFATPRMRLLCFCTIGLLAIYGLWAFLSAWLNCLPVAKFWDPTIDGFCFSKKGLWFSGSAVHILTDILVLIYPMPVLKSLQLPRRQKIAVMAVFALGAFVMVTSILRLKSLQVIADSTDSTYDNPGAAMWSAIEINVAIICACLPGTRAFITKLLPRFFSSRRGNYRSQSNKTPRSRYANISKLGLSATAGPSDYHMESIVHHGHAADSDSKEDNPWDADTSGNIKVTTSVSQESMPHIPENSSSVRHLV